MAMPSDMVKYRMNVKFFYIGYCMGDMIFQDLEFLTEGKTT
jgi:hypothetical protein